MVFGYPGRILQGFVYFAGRFLQAWGPFLQVSQPGPTTGSLAAQVAQAWTANLMGQNHGPLLAYIGVCRFNVFACTWFNRFHRHVGNPLLPSLLPLVLNI